MIMDIDTTELYEQLWNVSFDCLMKNCVIARSLTNIMQKRAEYMRSQLCFSGNDKNKTFPKEFRKAYDELQNMGKSVQDFVSKWQEHFIGELANAGQISSYIDYKFDYIKPSIEYKTGQFVQLLVTDVPKTIRDVFCAVDKSQSDYFSRFETFQNAIKTPLDQLPLSGVVFAVMLDNVWFRAVRNRSECNIDEDKIAMCLLDSGEVLTYESTFLIAKLPEEFQTIPAFFMKIMLVAGDASVAFKRLDVICCKVISVQEADNLLRVEWLPEILIPDIKSQHTLTQIKQTGVEQEEGTEMNGEKECESDEDGVNLPVHNPEGECTLEVNTLCNGESKHCDNNYAISRDTMSKEELKLWDDLPESTTNAMKAVLGYIPKDDELICKFYDPETKGCFKGSNCRLRHVEKDPEGWTLDRDIVSVPITPNMEIPAQNTFVTLVPTMIVDFELFYCQIVPDDGFNAEFSQLMEDMNSPEVVAQYKPIKLVPSVRELVVAKYENVWYRAQVCDIFDKNVGLFYVDYGNVESLPIDEVRMCEDRFKYLPYQAVSCRVANARQIKPYHIEAIEQFTLAILDKTLKAYIIDNQTPWEVQIFDEDGFDVGHAMIMAKLALPRNALAIDDKSKIPG